MAIQKNSDRESQDTSASLLSTANFKKYGNVHSYLKDMFGDQFLGLVVGMQTPWDEEKS